jgi:hypothetical protein
MAQPQATHQHDAATPTTAAGSGSQPAGGAYHQPLRFAVSLTDPQGREVFRKQFVSQVDADEFAGATAELCPDYKVSWVDRIEGIAWERVGQSISVTASPRPGPDTSKATTAA